MMGTEPTSIPVPLPDCWHETIDHKEAMRRLSTRALTEDRRNEIAEQIPDVLDHYIVFANGFREYIRIGQQPARLLLMLPTRKISDSAYELACPMLLSQVSRSGKPRYFTTFELHRFESKRGALFEDGRKLPGFKRVQGVTLPVDVMFLRAEPGPGHPGGSSCCDACEFVHSLLDIHGVDWLCCFFGDGCGLIDLPV
jgi:hypothetical protein